MEPQHGLPEGSAPLVLLPSPQFRSTYSIGRTEVTTNSGTRTTASMMIDPRRMGGVTTSTSAVRTSNSFSIIGSHGNVASSAGPTTRSRLRSHNTVRSLASSSVRSTTSTAVPPPVANPSRKRKAPTSSSSERSKAPRIRGHRKKPPPGTDVRKAPPQVKSEKDDDKKPAAVVNCCICMSDVEPNDIAKIDGCDHRFCFCCIEKWSERENKCPLCKIRFHKIERIHRKYTKGSKNTKKVKQKDQRSDLSSGAALEGLLGKFVVEFLIIAVSSLERSQTRNSLFLNSVSFQQICIETLEEQALRELFLAISNSVGQPPPLLFRLRLPALRVASTPNLRTRRTIPTTRAPWQHLCVPFTDPRLPTE